MKPQEYAYDSGVHIDICPECKGIFISAEDLQDLRKFIHSCEHSHEAKKIQRAAVQALIESQNQQNLKLANLANEIDNLFFLDDLPGINRITS